MLLFGWGPLVFVGLYLLGVLAIGVYVNRTSQRTTMHDHYIAGGKLGYFSLALTIFATQVSGYTLIGMSGDAYRSGYFSVVWVVASLMTAAAMIAVAPRLHHLGKVHGYISPLDFLRHRYPGARVLWALCFVCMCIPNAAYILAQCKSMGEFVAGLTGGAIGPFWGALGLGAIVLVYEALGGMDSVVWTDVVQGLILLLALLILFGRAYLLPSGLPTEIHAMPLAAVAVPDIPHRVNWVSTCILFLSYPFYPHLMQRFFAAKSPRDLKVAISFSCVEPYIRILGAVSIGLLAINHDKLQPQRSDQVFPTLLLDLMEAGLWGSLFASLLMAATLAAMMSTMDSSMLSLSSMIVLDVAKRGVAPSLSERSQLILGKVVGVVLVLGSVVLTTVLRFNLASLLTVQANLLLQVAPTFILGMYHRGVAAPQLLPGLCAGAVLAALAPLFQPFGVHMGVCGLALNILLTAIFVLAKWPPVSTVGCAPIPQCHAWFASLGHHGCPAPIFVLAKWPPVSTVGDSVSCDIAEPFRRWQFWGGLVVLAGLSCPFGLSGTIQPVVWCFPLWAFLSLLSCVLLSTHLLWSLWRWWAGAPHTHAIMLDEATELEGEDGERVPGTSPLDLGPPSGSFGSPPRRGTPGADRPAE